MHEIALDLLILLAGIWVVAITLRPLGLPTVMGELIVGVLLGPAVFDLVQPGEAIQLLAEIGIFFLMFHAGVETQPVEFLDAMKRSLGVAIVGAVVPFAVSFGVAKLFGLDLVGATFVGLTMTATAVVITLTSLKDLGLSNTRLARVIIASCVIDDMLTLVFFGLVIGLLSGGDFDPLSILETLAKVVGFLTVSVLIGRFAYPRLALPFRSEGGKGFTFVLLTALAAGLFAEAIGLHMILGAYIAGLFFEEKVAHPNLVRIVKDRAYGIAYSFLGPIFFMSLGFSITFDISLSGVAFIVLLTLAVILGQIISAGGMALRIGLPPKEALTVGVGMCGRAEMAFILAALALSQGAFDQVLFTSILLTAFALNLFTPLALKACAVMLQGRAAWQADATSGIIQLDTFGTPWVEERGRGQLLRTLPSVDDAVVIYGYGPEVESLLDELDSRALPRVIIEEDESLARKLSERGERVVHAELAGESLDFQPIRRARAIVANGMDEHNALLAMSAREAGFNGPIVALIDNPNRRAPMQLAGASAAFTPNHVLAAVVAVRASPKIGPRITGVQPLGRRLEIAEIRIHDTSPLCGASIGGSALAGTGAQIVAQWKDDSLHSPPGVEESLQPGMLLVAAGTPQSIQRLGEIACPITQQGRIVVVGFTDVGSKLTEMLKDAGEDVRVIDEIARPGVDLAGDVLDPTVLQRGGVRESRAVIVACDGDSATLLAVTVVRSVTPEVPVIACVTQQDSVTRILQAGADSAFSVSEVTGQLLAHYVLDQVVSQQGRIKLSRVAVSERMSGRHPGQSGIRERSGCTVIAMERGGEVDMEMPDTLRLQSGDAIYICGTANAFERFYREFG